MGETQLVVDPPASALAVFAHPDCPIVNCGGALARWARQDSRTHLVVVTRGERGGRDADATDEEVMARRAALLQESAGRLGLTSVEILDFPDGELVNDLALRRAIVAAIRQLQPEAILFHDPTAVIYGDRYVSHPDHRAVGWAALDAVGAPSSGARYHADLGPPHRITHAYLCGSLQPDTFVDIGPVVGIKAAALRDHADDADSSDWIDDAVRARAEEAGEMAGVTHAEGFRRLSLG